MNLFTDAFALLTDISIIFNVFFGIIVVFYERKNPAVTWAWLMVILIVPFVGFMFYLLMGMDGKKYNIFQQKTRDDELVREQYDQITDVGELSGSMQRKGITRSRIFDITGHRHFNDMVYLNMSAGSGAFTKENGVSLFHEGNSKFESLLADIQNAQTFIHLEYYILKNDSLATKIIQTLAEQAQRGVEVKLLIDAMGCYQTPGTIFKPILDAGGHVATFYPPNLIRVNYRNHRKIAVIDGIIGYVGGLNIGNEYLGKSRRFGFWRDCHIRIVGDAVKELELRFIMDWNFCTMNKRNQANLKIRYKPMILKKVKIEGLPVKNRYFPDAYTAKSNCPHQSVNIQIISSGPDTKWHSIHDAYLKMIMEANRSIYIQSPYFVPSDSILEALRIAALSGIDVRIMIPATPDHPFVYWAALSYLGELLRAGVKCYQYEKGFVHSKLIIVDKLLSSVGTANMDIRSFSLNFEVNAFIYNEKVAAELEREFINDLEYCTEITPRWYQGRSLVTKAKESISRLLSPLL